MRLRTIGLISTLVLGLLAWPLLAEAQQTGKVYRIGYLTTSGAGSPATNSMYIALLQGLRELGYVEGQNLVLEYRYGKTKNLPKRSAVSGVMTRFSFRMAVIRPEGTRKASASLFADNPRAFSSRLRIRPG